MFIPNPKVLRRVFEFSIAGSRGGPVRLEILRLLVKRKMNINQISTEMKMDYKTIQHHMRVLERSNFVRREVKDSENIYSLSDLIRPNRGIMDVVRGMGKSR